VHIPPSGTTSKLLAESLVNVVQTVAMDLFETLATGDVDTMGQYLLKLHTQGRGMWVNLKPNTDTSFTR